MLITYLSSFIEFICLYIIIKSFLYISYKPTKNDYIAVLSILLILGMFPQDTPALSWSIGQLLYVIYVSIFISNNRLNNLFLYCLTFDTLLIVQFFSALIITFIPVPTNNEYISILGNGISLLLIMLLMRFHKIKSIYSIIMSSALPYRLILLNSYLILSIMLYDKRFYNKIRLCTSWYWTL